MTKSNYDFHRRKGNLRVLNRACKGSPALVEYESLPVRFRQLVEAKTGGHPCRLVEREDVFAKQIIYDGEAEAFYADYRAGKGALPEGTQAEYTSTASILNAVGRKALARAASWLCGRGWPGW